MKTKEVHTPTEAGYTFSMQNDNRTGVLDRLLEPISRCLTPESAKSLLKMQADPVAQERVAELAVKCNEGKLSVVEREEYETYVHAGNLVAILQAQARLLLKRNPAA